MTQSLASRFTLTQWLICLIAAIGFLFDTYELLMTPLVAAPAIAGSERLSEFHFSAILVT